MVIRQITVRDWLVRNAVAVGIATLATAPCPVAAQTHDSVRATITQTCLGCHDKDTSSGGLDLSALPYRLTDPLIRQRWILIHDRVQKGEMPPPSSDLPSEQRSRFVHSLAKAIHDVDYAEVLKSGRGPMRRLNRDEYQQNLRDVLNLPMLDIRDALPEDREGHHFNKTAITLDISRVQLTAYLDAAEAALLRAIARGERPPPVTQYCAVGRDLFAATETFGNREAMFFAKDSKVVDGDFLTEMPHSPAIEMALFRSAHWPYHGYPRGFVARLSGQYRVRFSARAVLQSSGYNLRAATQSVPMTFRARKPSGPDVSGDVRATGGLIDVLPQQSDYETTITLKSGETFEYSLLGLPVPLARNVNGGPPTYRYPPFPDGGQLGVAFQSLRVEGPLSPENWPPPSHRVLFGDLPIRASVNDNGLPVDVLSKNPREDARRLLRRFMNLAARQPVPEPALRRFEQLVIERLDNQSGFAAALLTGYKAFLCSPHMIFLHEPLSEDSPFAIASRLSHFLTNTRPDSQLMDLAVQKRLRHTDVLSRETNRLIDGPGFDRFVRNFTDYWLNLRHLYRDEPDVRLYPEYRFDAYLIESMERETREFFRSMVRANQPVRVLVDADFVFANDRLAEHYQLQPIRGSALRKTALPPDSPYGGLLTQAAILKVTANGTATSPVIRGAWIMDRLLGQPPPDPPVSVPAVEPDIRGAKTIRELLSRHTESKTCAVCHATFDPIGFALENFDILGGWRTRYRGLTQGERVTGIDRAGHDFAYTLVSPIDASGKLLDGRGFENVRDLKKLLAANPRILARNLIHQWTVYATGTPVRFSDRAEIKSLLDACSTNGYRTRDLLHGFIHSKVFLGPTGCK